MSKTRYDRIYKKISSKIHFDIMMYLRLYSRYTIFELFNKKLFYQRIESFKVVEIINKNRQVFRLKLSSTMKIYSVIFVIQLKSVTIERDFYNKSVAMKSSLVIDEH